MYYLVLVDIYNTTHLNTSCASPRLYKYGTNIALKYAYKQLQGRNTKDCLYIGLMSAENITSNMLKRLLYIKKSR